MLNSETTTLKTNHSQKRYRVFWFIFRWWFEYSVFGGIAFVAGISPFFPFSCFDCRSNFEVINSFIDLLFFLLLIVGYGAIIGAIAGLFVGVIHAIFIRFWVYYPAEDIQAFRRKVIWSNLLIPTGLMVFSTLFLVSLSKDFSELPTLLYIPVLAYAIVVIVGLLVSRKFLRWWI
jgi:hypothetical protein